MVVVVVSARASRGATVLAIEKMSDGYYRHSGDCSMVLGEQHTRHWLRNTTAQFSLRASLITLPHDEACFNPSLLQCTPGFLKTLLERAPRDIVWRILEAVLQRALVTTSRSLGEVHAPLVKTTSLGLRRDDKRCLREKDQVNEGGGKCPSL